ncbi:MAG: hypothetical protein ACI4KD_08300 [Oscillospiraceae bacterium]
MSSKMNENEMKQIEKKLQTLCSEMEATKKDIASSMADIVYEKNHDTRTQQIFDDLTSQGRRFVRDMNKVSELHSALLYCINATVESEKEACNIIGNPSSDNNTSSSNGDSPSTTTPSTDKETSTDERIGILEKYRATYKTDTNVASDIWYADWFKPSEKVPMIGGSCLWNYNMFPPEYPGINEDLACTGMTYLKLKEQGLYIPHDPAANGRDWVKSYLEVGGDPSRAKYGNGEWAIKDVWDEYLNSGQDEPLENIVVSFDAPYEQGHVLLIDKMFKRPLGDGRYECIVQFSDQGGLYPNGDYSVEHAIQLINSAPKQEMALFQFLDQYKRQNLRVNGAVVIGSP